jgi:hypothetical protein
MQGTLTVPVLWTQPPFIVGRPFAKTKAPTDPRGMAGGGALGWRRAVNVCHLSLASCHHSGLFIHLAPLVVTSFAPLKTRPAARLPPPQAFDSITVFTTSCNLHSPGAPLVLLEAFEHVDVPPDDGIDMSDLEPVAVLLPSHATPRGTLLPRYALEHGNALPHPRCLKVLL